MSPISFLGDDFYMLFKKVLPKTINVVVNIITITKRSVRVTPETDYML
jgi:hypothetical protein